MASTRLTDMGAWMRQVDERLRTTEFAAMQKRPRAIISRQAALAPNQGQASIQWDTSQHQTTLETAIWAVGNPTVLKMPLQGWWKAVARAGFAANATGIRQLLISHDTGGELDRDIHLNPTATSNAMLRCERMMYSDGTNFFVVQTLQSSGGALNLAVGHRFTRVELEYLGQ